MKAVLLAQLMFFGFVGLTLASLADGRVKSAEARTALVLTHVPLRELSEIRV